MNFTVEIVDFHPFTIQAQLIPWTAQPGDKLIILFPKFERMVLPLLKMGGETSGIASTDHWFNMTITSDKEMTMLDFIQGFESEEYRNMLEEYYQKAKAILRKEPLLPGSPLSL